MELDTAARHMALADATITGYVVAKVFKYRLMEGLQGTGGRAVVFRRDGGWGRPDESRTVEYPVLKTECWADVDRDDNGEQMAGKAEEKAWALWRALNARLHMVRGERWGYSEDPPRDGLYIVRASRWSEASIETSQSVASERGASLERALLIEGGAVVRCSYALEIAVGAYA